MGFIRKFFAGSNSSEGFYSLFKDVITNDAKRVYLLKGGPGTGKSYFMRSIEQELVKDGHDREQFYCSSDADSLDAICFPRLGIALIDATAPHAIEPQWPGCRDEIIYLGNFWSSQDLYAKREQIMQGGLAKQKHFANAFRYFKAAKCIEDTMSGDAQRIFWDNGDLDRVHSAIKGQVIAEPKRGKIRTLFASALTPQGHISHIRTLIKGYSELFVLQGLSGSGKSAEIKRIANHTQIMGLDAELFLYPLNPQKVLHLLIPQLKIAILTATVLDPLDDLPGACRILMGPTSNESSNARSVTLFNELLGLGMESLRQAQSGHAEIEEIYMQQMDFKGLDKYKDEILAEINFYKNLS